MYGAEVLGGEVAFMVVRSSCFGGAGDGHASSEGDGRLCRGFQGECMQ